MRFIRNTAQSMLSVIAGEMLNQEYGLKLFHEGKYIELEVHQSIPNICFDGVKILVKPNFGLLYVDERQEGISDDYMRWVKLLASRVEALAAFIPGRYSRSNQYTTVDNGEDGFTSMKIKIRYTGTKYCKESQIPKGNHERSIFAASMAQIENFKEKIGLSRFTWIVYPLNRIYHSIHAAAENPNINKALMSYFTLVYDPTSVIRDHTNPANETILRDLTLLDIKYIKQVLPLYSAGVLNLNDLINECKPKRDPKTPDALTPVQPVNDHAFAQVSLDNLTQHTKFHINQLRCPAFVPGLQSGRSFRIMYCPTRLGAIELIKQFGRFSFDNLAYNSYNLPVRAIGVDVFDIQMDQVVIDNTPSQNDGCAKCLTPLYDNIYLTYNTHDSPTAKAYCSVCMHSSYNQNGDICYVRNQPDQNVTRLYHNVSVLAKTKYPRTYNQVIDTINDETVKEVLRAMYSATNTAVIKSGMLQFVFLECKANQRDFNPNIYVGFENLGDYLDYCYQNPIHSNQVPARNVLMGANETQFYERTVLFPIQSISNEQ